MRIHILTLILAVSLLTACGADSNSAEQSRAPAFDAAQYALASDPSDAISTTAARERSEDGDVVVVGRVHLIERNGRAMFKLQDEALMYCGQGEEDCGCLTPWDYCCEDVDKYKAGDLPVEVRGADGLPVPATAEQTGLRLLDLIAVKGRLETSEGGGKILVVTDGWFRRERPTLPDGLEWPN